MFERQLALMGKLDILRLHEPLSTFINRVTTVFGDLNWPYFKHKAGIVSGIGKRLDDTCCK